MGKTTTNPLLTGVSGRIGDLLIKQYKTGTVITLMPSLKRRKANAKEKLHRATFAAAVKYARDEKTKQYMRYENDNPEKFKDVYHPAIKRFMAAAKEAKAAGKFNPDGGPLKVNAAAVLEIIEEKEVAAEAAQANLLVEKKVAVKKVMAKKAAVKKTVKKAVKK